MWGGDAHHEQLPSVVQVRGGGGRERAGGQGGGGVL